MTNELKLNKYESDGNGKMQIFILRICNVTLIVFKLVSASITVKVLKEGPGLLKSRSSLAFF